MSKISIELTEKQAFTTMTLLGGIYLRNQANDPTYAAFIQRIHDKISKSLAKAKTS